MHCLQFQNNSPMTNHPPQKKKKKNQKRREESYSKYLWEEVKEKQYVVLNGAGKRHSSNQKKPWDIFIGKHASKTDNFEDCEYSAIYQTWAKSPSGQDNSSEEPRLPRTQGKRVCFQTPQTIRVSCSFTWRGQTVSYKKLLLATMACKKEKIKLLLILGKVFIVACACTELVFDKGVFQKRIKRKWNHYLSWMCWSRA